MLRLKIVVSKALWKIAGYSPKMGNLVMDIIGYDNYCKVMRYQRM